VIDRRRRLGRAQRIDQQRPGLRSLRRRWRRLALADEGARVRIGRGFQRIVSGLQRRPQLELHRVRADPVLRFGAERPD